MNRTFILQVFLILCICCSCKSQGNGDGKHDRTVYKSDSIGIDIDSIYSNLSLGNNINYQEVSGAFTYLENDAKTGKYLARFSSKGIKETINYVSYADDKKDAIVLDNTTLNLEAKVDPTSIKVYRFLFNNKKYLIFIGKAQSASGSGMQVTYFILTELNQRGKAINHYEFESRFGNINSLVDYDKNGTLDYFKIVNGNKNGEYILTINEVQAKKQTNNGHVLLKYELNDEFNILADNLSR